MGLGSPSFVLAWGPTGSGVLAADIAGLIQNPAVLLGAAAVVVVAVLIVLIMVLRGGSKKSEVASEMDDGQEAWESAPRGAASVSGRDYEPRDQMLPWEQGGGRGDGGRQQASGKRGPGGRDAQPGWGQAAPEAQWESQGQPSPRGGQWVGTDEWAPEPAMGRGNVDQRGQGQMGPRDNEGWGWAANQAPAGGPPADQWGQGAPSPMGRGDNQWGQGPGAASHPMERGDDQWGQGAGTPYAMGRGDDQWGQGAGTPSHPMGRGDDQWGQGAPMRGRGQDQWGGQPAPNGHSAGQVEDQSFDPRGGPRRGPEPAGQPEGQWGGQGQWGQANAGWGNNEPADQWGQAAPAQPPQAARPAPQGAGRPSGQGSMPAMGPSQGAGNEWGAPGFTGPASGGAQPGGSWGERDQPAWQVEPRRDQPAWEMPSWQSPEPEPPASRSGPRNQPPAPPQWESAGRGSAEPAAWEGAGAANDWGQPAPAPKPNLSRPIEPAAARGPSQPPAPAADWGNRDFERPTAKPASQPPSWEQRDAPPWQTPAPQMAAPAGPADAPTVRPGTDARQLGKASPEVTAYSPPAAEASEGAADKTVVMRKDAGAGRSPGVVVRQGKEPGRAYDMRKDHLTIGRSRDSDIFLEDLAVSRLHATIYRDEMGGYYLRDENSANGTSVNGQRVTEVALQEGDEIQLGQTILAFVRR
jgi:FHA domain